MTIQHINASRVPTWRAQTEHTTYIQLDGFTATCERDGYVLIDQDFDVEFVVFHEGSHVKDFIVTRILIDGMKRDDILRGVPSTKVDVTDHPCLAPLVRDYVRENARYVKDLLSEKLEG